MKPESPARSLRDPAGTPRPAALPSATDQAAGPPPRAGATDWTAPPPWAGPAAGVAVGLGAAGTESGPGNGLNGASSAPGADVRVGGLPPEMAAGTVPPAANAAADDPPAFLAGRSGRSTPPPPVREPGERIGGAIRCGGRRAGRRGARLARQAGVRASAPGVAGRAAPRAGGLRARRRHERTARRCLPAWRSVSAQLGAASSPRGLSHAEVARGWRDPAGRGLRGHRPAGGRGPVRDAVPAPRRRRRRRHDGPDAEALGLRPGIREAERHGRGLAGAGDLRGQGRVTRSRRSRPSTT